VLCYRFSSGVGTTIDNALAAAWITTTELVLDIMPRSTCRIRQAKTYSHADIRLGAIPARHPSTMSLKFTRQPAVILPPHLMGVGFTKDNI
jgi:hypothetical protein